MPRNSKRAKLPMTSPWLEHWSKCQTEISSPEGCGTPSSSYCRRSTRDVGTQTPPSLLFMAVTEETARDIGSRNIEMRSRRNSATDWTQMGRDLRQIADDLKHSTESLKGKKKKCRGFKLILQRSLASFSRCCVSCSA